MVTMRFDEASYVTRYDVGVLQAPVETDEGFLKVTGYASRVGVFVYQNPDGTLRRELRLPEEVFAPDSLKSYEGKPMTARHPGGPVTSRNVKKFGVGMVLQPATQDGDHVAFTGVLTDASAIFALKSKKLPELSSGYRLHVENTAGVHPVYGAYDAIQRDIRINHLALVEMGRAGPTARISMDDLRADGVDDPGVAVMVTDTAAKRAPFNRADVRAKEIDTTGGIKMADPKKPDPKKPDPKADDPSYIDAGVAAAELSTETKRADKAELLAEANRKRADAAEGEVLGLKKQVEDLEASAADETKLDELNVKIDQLETELTETKTKLDAATDPKVRKAAVASRVALEKIASIVLDRANFDDVDDRDLMVEVISKRGGEVKSDHTDDHVRGQFDALVKSFARGEASLARLRKIATPVNQDGTRAQAKSARDAYIEERQNAWKRPAAATGKEG